MPGLLLRLYITGNSPNSIEALANLEAIRARYFPAECQVEIIDVQKQPARSLEEGVLIVPTLIKEEPGPRVTIIGNLSEQEKVLAALGLAEPAPPATERGGDQA
jgi:circadian clock protein KaiB